MGELFPLFKCFEREVPIKRTADQEFTQARDISLVDAWSTYNLLTRTDHQRKQSTCG